jgi:asparagine synthase (glutamine-hydrolysing)
MPQASGAGTFYGAHLFGGKRAGAERLLARMSPPENPGGGQLRLSRAPARELPGRPGSWLQFASRETSWEEAAGLFLRSGGSFTSELRGKFAFAVFDAAAGEILIGSDRFSEITVYYARLAGGIAWADTPAPLLRLPGVDAGIDPEAVDRFLTMRYVPSPLTLNRGVRKLPPASALRARAGSLRVRNYWSPPMDGGGCRTAEEAAQALRAALIDSVKFRLRGARRAAALVSGGLDSSAVAAAAASLGVALETFTIGTPGKGLDFRRAGERLARALGSRHEYLPYASPAAADLAGMAAAYPEPQSDHCAVPLWLAAGRLKGGGALLSGDGGDENFGGYERTRLMLQMARKEKGPEMETLLARASAAKGLTPETLKKARSAVCSRLDTIYSELARIFLSETGNFSGRGALTGHYTGEFVKALGSRHKTAQEELRDYFRSTSLRDWLARTAMPDLAGLHPECAVPRVRAAAERCGRFSVMPFNDHRLVELAWRIPEKFKIPPGRTGARGCKSVLRRAVAGLVPEKLVSLPKLGFGTPAAEWLAGPLRELFRDAVLARDARTAAFFRRSSADSLFSEHLAKKRDRTEELWTLLMLELWLRSRSAAAAAGRKEKAL